MGMALARAGRKKKSVQVEYHGLPTRERMAKAGKDYEVGGDARTGKVIRVMDAPLDRMRSRQMIGGREYEALNKFRIHWWHAGLSGAVRSPEIDRVFADPLNSSHMAASERQAHHRGQYRKARAIFAQTTENDKMLIVLEGVLCAENTLEMMGYAVGCKSRFRARERSKDLLLKAADMLVKHWGI